MDTIEKEIIDLRLAINEHNYRYYAGQPTITDAEFDGMMTKLSDLEKDFPRYFDPNSPTQKVGSPVPSTFSKVEHRRKMLSLNNGYSPTDVSKFLGDNELVSEGKIDGMSLSLIYSYGKLVRAVTRGDGSVGDNVTENAKTIRTIPLVITDKTSEIVEVRGEVIMLRSTFNSLASDEDTEFANPRNAASGTMRLKDSREVRLRKLDFIAYDVAVQGNRNDNRTENYKLLEELGFPYTPARMPFVSGVKAVECSVKSIEDSVKFYSDNRDNLDFDIDGVVFKVNSYRVSNELGEGTKFPKWAIAYKYPPERKIATLVDITVSIGRHGTITPVAHFEGIKLSGTIVKKASLCNRDEIERLGINIGDEVYVEKSAEIIPKVMGLHKKGDNEGCWKYPDNCPCCGRQLKQEEGMVAIRCKNYHCKEQALQRICYAVSKHALDFDGIGEKHIESLVNSDLYIRDISDLFYLEREDLIPILKKAATNSFLKSAERAKTLPLWRKLAAFGIEGIGKSYCQDLANKYGSLENILDAGNSIKDILGEVHTKSFRLGILRSAGTLIRMEDTGFVFKDDKKIGSLSGKVFVITGKLERGSRDDFIAFVEANGGVVKSSVSKKVDYLISGEDPGGNKTQGALRNGVKIITEDEFMRISGKESITC